jgi:transcriptional regulator with XRE-family HTH domain
MNAHQPTKKEGSRKVFQMRPGAKNLIGFQIRLFRERRGWTQRRLAECFRKEGILVTRDMIASIETQRCTVTDYQIVFFARVLGVSWKSLFPDKTILENLTPPAALRKESEVASNMRTKRRTPDTSADASVQKWNLCEMTCKSVKITFRGRS